MITPRSLEQKLCLFASADKEAEGGLKLELVSERHQWYMGDEYILIDKVDIRVNISSNFDLDELRLKAIETLRQKQRQARVEAQEKINALEAKIQELQLLTYTPETELS